MESSGKSRRRPGGLWDISFIKKRVWKVYGQLFIFRWSCQLSVFSFLDIFYPFSSWILGISADQEKAASKAAGRTNGGRISNGNAAGKYFASGGICCGERLSGGSEGAEKIYEQDAFILKEFRYLVGQIGLNRTVEALLMELGKRSHVEDIQNFAEVFYTAKRTGGDLLAIIRNTVSEIQQKQETRQEIATSLSGKVMEQNMMSVIPLLILGYVKLTSPGFLDAMYGNWVGIVIMSICFIVYLTAYFWGRKIIDIQV